MDVFRLREKLVNDYSSYTGSFIKVSDNKMSDAVQAHINAGSLWPEPLLQLNPSFESGGAVSELVREGLLHGECERIFRFGKSESNMGKPMRLHRHQVDAIRLADKGGNYVLTTGTGSGKSLSYIIPIVDHVLRNGSGKGVQAIIIYPMNALANSQENELEKFIHRGYPEGSRPVTFKRYTGQESDEQKKEIIKNPPDILLTNYVMMELILTRTDEKELIERACDLRFLVLDELHTYRGRQGSDVAMLVRRTRDLLGGDGLQCVGTSATMAGPGTIEEQKAEVALVASQLFGADVAPGNIIGETLQRSTVDLDFSQPKHLENLRAIIQKDQDPEAGYESFRQSPLSSWIETTLGISREDGSGPYIRVKPRGIEGEDGAAGELAKLTGLDEHLCARAIRRQLMGGYEARDPATDFPVFAFRLHQFISKGDAVYASPEPPEDRYISLKSQQYVPGDRERILLPVAFCRECGREYYTVRRQLDPKTKTIRYTPRDLTDRYNDEDSGEAGYLCLNAPPEWHAPEEKLERLLPEEWGETSPAGTYRVKKHFKQYLPKSVMVKPDGREGVSGVQALYTPAPFRFCYDCGVSYSSRTRSDYGKLGTLGTEGRSTATTLLSLSAVRNLLQEDLPNRARKVLSFTDNRQDASLQAGHFNDFIEVGLIRAALYAAASEAGEQGLQYDTLAQQVFEKLNLPRHRYSRNPTEKFAAKKETDRTFMDVIGYRVYYDLRRGWRITSPNLEQCGLLGVQYESLDELCEDADTWKSLHPALVTAEPELRQEICQVLLDHMRKKLVIDSPYLDATYQDALTKRTWDRLIPPWSFEEGERPQAAPCLVPRRKHKDDERGRWDEYLSGYSTFATYLRNKLKPIMVLKRDESEEVIQDLLKALNEASLVTIIHMTEDGTPGYRIPASAFRLNAADGTQAVGDPLQTPRVPEEGRRSNQFFVNFYRNLALNLTDMMAGEHTAQVPAGIREDREQLFRCGMDMEALQGLGLNELNLQPLPILFCSPTMELGIDIEQLNVVNMRNVPPTPANYAQRSGRAGRSGQPALIFSYCTTGSSHDQYFFDRPREMVAGAVAPPRLDLANEDLVRAHVQAIWLGESHLKLGKSLQELLELGGEDPTLALQQSVLQHLEDPTSAQKALVRSRQVLGNISEELSRAEWYHDAWLEDTLRNIKESFEGACVRWRSLYRAALKQAARQDRVIRDATRKSEEKKEAERLRRDAEAQLKLLIANNERNSFQSDFYSYRYFASEGFLPGYNFPRLPLSAFIPGRPGLRSNDEFLSRPRFLAISEFGPRSIVYHEGSRYSINKVIIPVEEQEGDFLLGTIKKCASCGYLHTIEEMPGPENCEFCDAKLPDHIDSLFKLHNVVAKRMDKITSDEEERLRMGYDITPGFRFNRGTGGALQARQAGVQKGGKDLATLHYAEAATLWRINLGWNRKSKDDSGAQGFVLDRERGYWGSNKQMEDMDPEDPMSKNCTRVIPYVEDRRNCLCLDFVDGFLLRYRPKDISTEDWTEMRLCMIASLQAAFKVAIQSEYQLEDNELSVESLPDRKTRNLLLFYESAEGGAGVLRRIASTPASLPAVARKALEICHFDPESGEDLAGQMDTKDPCEAACYRCLMSYSNQLDHLMLDRKLILPILLDLARSTVDTSPTADPRREHLEGLLRLCGSDLEKEWLMMVHDHGLRLPDRAQYLIESCGTRPDFLYEQARTAIYVDGPHHDFPERQQRDKEQMEALDDLGVKVIRFSLRDDWRALLEKHSSLFGSMS